MILSGSTVVAHTIVSPGDHSLDLSATETVRINVAVDCPILADFSIRIIYDGGMLEYVADSGDFTSPRLLIEDAPQIVEDAPGSLRFTAHPFMNAGTASVDAGSGTLFSFELSGLNYGVYALDVEVIKAEFVSTFGDSTEVQAGSVTVTGIGDIVFAPAAGHYAVAQDVALSSTDSEEIRYTTDGTEPDNTSTLYAGPVNISAGDGESVTVRAIAFDDYDPPRFLLGEAEYNFDTSLPTVALTPVATPRTTAVSTLTIVFNEAVLNFAVADLSLTRDGGGNLLPGGEVLTTEDSISWTLLPVSEHTAADGSYVFAVDSSGITDLAGNDLVADDSINWAMDGPPSATITPVAPDPITTAVAGVTFTFTEPVTGFDSGDLTLTRDGGSNLLNGSETLNSGDDITFELSGLSAFTGDDGDYVLTLPGTGTGIVDLSAKPLSAGSVESWSKDTVAPSLEIPAIVPDPRNLPVADATLTFSEPVTGFDIGDLSLTRDGGGNLLTTQALTSADDQNWTLDGLAGVTGVAGTYALAVAAGAAVADLAGNALPTEASAQWLLDLTLPTATFEIVIDPRSAALGQIDVTLSEPVTGVDVTDFSLTRAGGGELLTGAEPVTTLDNMTWTLAGLTPVTGDEGDYVLTLSAATDILDAAGNGLDSDAVREWYMDQTAPTAIIEIADPDPRNLPVSDLAITFNEAVTGFGIEDLALTRDGGPDLLPGTAVLSGDGTDYQLSGLAALTGVEGNYTLELVATGSGIEDLALIALEVGDIESWRLDTQAPTVAITPVSDPRNSAVSTLAIVFSEPVDGFNIADLDLQLDSNGNLLSAEALTSMDNQSWTLSGLAALTAVQGQYGFTLGFVAAGITDDAGNALAAGDTIDWTMDTLAPSALITAVDPDPRNSPVATITIVFDEAVTGFEIEDLSLTRDDGADLLPGGTVLTSSDSLTWTLSGLDGLTAASGQYTLALDGSGLGDAAGNAPANVDEKWDTDTVPPTVNITPVDPDPRTSSVASIEIVFDKPVTGFDVDDLTLTRNAGVNRLFGSEPLTSSDDVVWTLGGISGLTASGGDYELTITAPGGITDAVGNALAESGSMSWNLDVVAPTVVIGEVATPRLSSVPVVTFAFSEAVSGFSLNNLTLTRDGGADLLGNAQDLFSGNTIDWQLTELGGITNTPGSYVLSVQPDNVLDSVGNEMEVGAQITWVVDTTAPAVDFAAVTDPRNLPVDMVTFTFDEPVTGVGIEDLSLTRDGSGNLLTGGERVESGDNTTWTLMDLNAITSADGDYVLMLVHAGSDIVDAATNALETSAERQWHMDATPPTLQITAIAPNPRIQPVADATLTFSEPINDFVIGDLSLTRDGGANLLTTQALTSADNQAWTLDGLDILTAVDGAYELTLTAAGSEIVDAVGNALAGSATEEWSLDTQVPTVEITAVEDPRNSTVLSISLAFSEPITGLDIGDFALQLDNGADLLIGNETLIGNGTLWTLSDLNDLTGDAGQYLFTLVPGASGIADAANNLLSAGDNIGWQMDTQVPTAEITAVAPDPRNSAVDEVTITLIEAVTGFDKTDLTLTRDGSANLLDGSESLDSADDITFTFSGLAGFTVAEGVYTVTVVSSGAGIADAAGNLLEADAIGQWRVDATPPTLQITAIAPDPRIQPVADATLTFSEPVNGFVLDALSLTRDGGANLLTTQALTSADNQAWTLDDLAGVTGVAGTYILAVAAGAAVADSVGNEMEVGAQITWDYGIGISGNITYDGTQEGALTLEVFAGSAIAGDWLESHSLAGRATAYDIVMLPGIYSFRAFVDGGGGTYDAGEAADAVSQLDVDLAGDTAGIDFELYDWTHAFAFAAGWHWISFPGPPLATSFGEFQTAINGAVWGQAQQVVSVAAGQIAYWIYCHGEKSADIRGLNPVTEDTALVADWNHFGVSDNAVAPAVGGAYQSVVWTWEEGRFESVAPDAPLVPFKGYYVNVSIGTLLEVE